ncbi:MAG: hypothetical protein EBR82_76425 [Caulobacteraceae bacterium]|nr:hypothetical protein [Caulobacteraceae bacterium]
MNSYMDQIRCIVKQAIESQNPQEMCDAAMLFASRFGGIGYGGHLPPPYQCSRVRKRADGFDIQLKEKTLIFSRRLNRWLLSENADDWASPYDSFDAAVNETGVPFAFLEGIQYALECIECAAGEQFRDFSYDVSKAQGELAVVKSELERASCCLVELHKESNRLDRRIKGPKFKAAAHQRSKVAFAGGELPDAPTTLVSLHAAKTVFKKVSGVYFLWIDGNIDYVGRADDIAKRLSSHHVATDEHWVSIVEMSIPDSWLNEPHYIWKHKPRLNSNVQQAAKKMKESEALS